MLGELSVILSKDPRRKLPRGSCPLICSKDQCKKLTCQSRAYNALKIEEEESAEEETLKILVIFKNHQRIHEEELQKEETLKISRNSFKFVKKLLQKAASCKAFWKSLKSIKDYSRQRQALKNPCISFKYLKYS